MKIKPLLASAFVLVFSGPFASALEIAPTLGLNLSNISRTSNTISISPSSKLSTELGVLVSDAITGIPGLEVQSGLLLDTRKYWLSNTVSITTQDTTTTYSYLQLPVLLRYQFPVGLSAGAGFYLSKALGDVGTRQVTVSGGFTTEFEGSRTFDAEKLKTTDFGLLVSAGYRVPVAPRMTANFDARYLFGLANLNDDPNRPDISIKWTSLQLLAGLGLEF